ncbi:MAG: hypothetical protein DBX47_00900 [Clostridiales bacterium]|nr:MAG: hypothetical protein DBX47_00900 [Clostridiales bacterium]
MTFFIIVALSVIISYSFNFKKYKIINDRAEQIVLYSVLFSMGVSLGADDVFFTNFPSLGLDALIFAVSGGVFSVFIAWFLTRRQK